VCRLGRGFWCGAGGEGSCLEEGVSGCVVRLGSVREIRGGRSAHLSVGPLGRRGRRSDRLAFSCTPGVWLRTRRVGVNVGISIGVYAFGRCSGLRLPPNDAPNFTMTKTTFGARFALRSSLKCSGSPAEAAWHNHRRICPYMSERNILQKQNNKKSQCEIGDSTWQVVLSMISLVLIVVTSGPFLTSGALR